jgi:hypothetical protein
VLREQQRAFSENLAQLGPGAVLVHHGSDGSHMAAWTGLQSSPSSSSPVVVMIADLLTGMPVSDRLMPPDAPVTGRVDGQG